MRMAQVAARGGLCVVAVLHDLNLSAAACDRLVVLSGRVVAEGRPGDVLTDARAEVWGIPVWRGENGATGSRSCCRRCERRRAPRLRRRAPSRSDGRDAVPPGSVARRARGRDGSRAPPTRGGPSGSAAGARTESPFNRTRTP
jgi:hypothetical protein